MVMNQFFLAACMCFALTGCATSNYTVGRDFSSASVAQIQKGKTTTSEVVALFGEPFAKSAVSETEADRKKGP